MSNLERLERQMIVEEFGNDDNNLEWTILDEIDAEIMRKKKQCKKVGLYENDNEEELDYCVFENMKNGDIVYFKSSRRWLKTFEGIEE